MFERVIFRLALRYTSRRLFQSILFIIGVALGVAVVVAIDLANGSASRAFGLSALSVTGSATHQITGGASGLPTHLYTQIRLELGIRASAPIIAEQIRVDGITQSLRLLGVDPFAEPPFRDYLTQIEVIGEGETTAFQALNRFIAEPRTAIIAESLAQRANLATGDEISVSIGANRQTLRIIGVMRPADRLSQQALDDLILTDIATAQEIAGLSGRISRIDLILTDEQVPQVQTILPLGITLSASSTSGGALAQMTEAFELNLQALSLLAVVVGVFLIYNTVTFSVVQRRPVIGILRSIGATKRQIFAFIIGEAWVLGIIGTVLGLGLGIIFGRLMVGLVAQTISDLYFAVNVTSVTVTPLSLLKGIGLGMVTSTVAALIPSIDATRTAPTGSMRRSSLEEKTRELIPYLSFASLIFLVIAYLLLQIPTTNLIISFGALFCVIFSGALITPFALLSFLWLVTPITERLFGVLGRIAPRSIIRSLSRTSIAVAALTIAVSVIIGVSVMIDSFRDTVANWLDNTLSADIYISPQSITSNASTTDVDPLLGELVATVAGIDSVSTSRSVQAIAPDYPNLPPVNLTVIDFDLAGSARGFVWKSVDDAPTALAEGQVMVSEPFAFRRGITPENASITLVSDQGERTFEVLGVYYDYSTDQGAVIMARTTYDQYWNDPFVSAIAAFITPDANLDNVLNTLKTDVLAEYDVRVQSNRDLRQSVFDVFDRTFTITIALRLLATVVAFIGILSALMSLQLENIREYGVLRANGMTPNQIRGFTFIQTGLMGVAAGLMALPIGVVLAVVLVYVINVRSFGWTLQFQVQNGQLLQAFAVAIIAALLAGIYPAYQLAKMNITRAIRSE